MMDVTVETTATQALHGTRLAAGGKTECTECDRTIRDGDEVGVYATRPADRESFDTPRVYCRGCRPEEIAHPTLGAPELLVFGRLAVTSDAASRTARTTLRDTEPVAYSPPDEGVDA